MRYIRYSFSIMMGAALFIIAALFIGPNFVDWDRFRPEIESQLRNMLGRDIAIAGKIELTLLPAPFFAVENITIASVSGSKNVPLFTAQSLEAHMDLIPLVSGDVRFTHLNMVRPVLTLERFKDGRDNFNFARAIGETVAAEGDPGILDNIRLDSFSIENGVIRYIDRKRGWVNAIRNVSATISAASLIGPFKAEGAFQYLNITYQGRAASGRFSAGKAVPLDLELHGKENALRTVFSGILTAEAGQRGLDGVVIFETAASSWLFGASPEERGKKSGAPVRIEAGLTFNNRRVSLRDIRMALGTTRLEGRADTNLENQDAALALTLKGKGLDADRVFGTGGKGLKEFRQRLNRIEQLVERVGGRFPQNMSFKVNVLLESLVHDGQLVRDIAFQQTVRLGKTEQIALRAILPGQTRLQFSMSQEKQEQGKESPFTGSLALTSRAPKPLLLWLAGGYDPLALALRDISPAFLGRLELSAPLIWDGDRLAFNNIELRLAKSRAQGKASYKYANAKNATPALAIELNMDSFRAQGWQPFLIALPALMRGDLFSKDLAERNMRVHLSAKEASAYGENFTNVLLRLEAEGQKLTLERLSANAPDKGEVNLEGVIHFAAKDPKAEPLPNMALRLRANLPKPEPLLTFFGGDMLAKAQRDALAPLRLMAEISSGGEIGNAGALKLKARARKSDIIIDATMKRPTDPKGAWLDLNLRAQNPNPKTLLRQIGLPQSLALEGKGARNKDKEKEAEIRLAFNGTLNEPAKLNANLAIGEASYNFTGEALWKNGAPDFLAGNFTAKGESFREPAAATGFGRIDHLARKAFNLSAAIEKQGRRLSWKDMRLVILNGEISGDGIYEMGAKGGDNLVEARLTSEIFPLALIWSDRNGDWSANPLPLEGIRRLTGDIRLSADTARAKTFTLSELKARLELSPEAIIAKDFRAQIAGGNLRASLQWNHAAAKLQADFSLTSANMRDISQMLWSAKALSGTVGISGAIEGEGRAPLSLVSSLKGSGRLIASKGVFHGFDASIVDKTIAQIKNLSQMGKLFTHVFSGGDTPFGSPRGAFALKDGILSVTRLPLKAKGVDGRANIHLDLSRLALDAELLFAPPSDKTLSDFRLTLTGRAAAPRRRVDTHEFEQSFAARIIEKSAQDLAAGGDISPELADLLGISLEEEDGKAPAAP